MSLNFADEATSTKSCELCQILTSPMYRLCKKDHSLHFDYFTSSHGAIWTGSWVHRSLRHSRFGHHLYDPDGHPCATVSGLLGKKEPPSSTDGAAAETEREPATSEKGQHY